MDKTTIRARIISALQDELAVAAQAADEARETATHEDSVAQNQYDTFGLEASYLAEGQSKRVRDLQTAISRYQKLLLKTFDADTPIALGALVTLESAEGTEKRVFVGPDAGGLKIDLDGESILVITPGAPLGKALIGRLVGEEVPSGAPLQGPQYEITQVY